MKIYLIFVLFIIINLSCFAQKLNKIDLEKSVNDFNNALIAKDTVALNILLDDNISYGHSNGWIQTKHDLKSDLYNGKITYNKINASSLSMSIDGNVAWVRSITDLDVILETKPLQFKLNALQVWIYKKKLWVLFARQSVKM